jgi:hypothetical protein
MTEELVRLRAVAERLEAMIGTADEAYIVDDPDPVALALSGVPVGDPAIAADGVVQPAD